MAVASYPLPARQGGGNIFWRHIRVTLRFLVAAAAAVAPLNPVSAAELPPRPNIVFILTDDQGYGEVACHGNRILKTPSLDRLHRESVRFTDFHVSPTCAPTRAALMTGRHEFRSGVTHTIMERERMSLKATTLVQVLKAAGYTTGIFWKVASWRPSALSAESARF